MVDFLYKDNYTVKDLEEIVFLLRQPDGCPWDREQTHESIRRNFLEETYEAVEAIDCGDTDHLKEELGDVLLQIALHACMEAEAGVFTLDDVADGICKKLIFRHPHVFGQVEVKDTTEVLSNWDALKRVEKGQDTYSDTLSSVARSLPALWRAEKVQKKAKKSGFDWPDISGAVDKLAEEVVELKEAVTNQTNMEEELGDVLFSAVNVARFLKSDPEEVLTSATDKFIARFTKLEALATAQGAILEDMSLEQMEDLWQQAKG